LQEREAHEAEVDELNGLLEDKYNQIKNSDGTNRENTQASRHDDCVIKWAFYCRPRK
jgi:hypothetical protein